MIFCLENLNYISENPIKECIENSIEGTRGECTLLKHSYEIALGINCKILKKLIMQTLKVLLKTGT